MYFLNVFQKKAESLVNPYLPHFHKGKGELKDKILLLGIAARSNEITSMKRIQWLTHDQP